MYMQEYDAGRDKGGVGLPKVYAIATETEVHYENDQ